MNIPTYTGGYKQWKIDRNLPDLNTTIPPPQQQQQTAPIQSENGIKRNVTAAFGNTSKKKGGVCYVSFIFFNFFFVVKRSRMDNRDSDDSSVDSDGEEGGNFKDKKGVYNR